MAEKRIQAGNEGEELVPGFTENLSSALPVAGDAARPDALIGKEEAVIRRDQFDRREEELAERRR